MRRSQNVSSLRSSVETAPMTPLMSTSRQHSNPHSGVCPFCWFAGDRDEALTECVFLLELHQNRTNATINANITATQPVPSDPSGKFLKQLLNWRQNRIDAIKWELQRLSEAWNITQQELQELLEQQQQQQRADGAAGFTAHPGGAVLIDPNFSSNSSDPWQRMLDWMRHNGAVVSLRNTAVQHTSCQIA